MKGAKWRPVTGAAEIPMVGFGELILFLTPHIVASDDDEERAREAVESRTRDIERAKKDNPAVFRSKP